MTAKTLTALKASIAHHESNLAAEMPGEVALNRRNCALCRKFNRLSMSDSEACTGCPVADKTGKQFCDGTPFYDLESAYYEWKHDPKKTMRALAFRKAEREEIKFLKSLLPKEGKA